MPLSHRHTFKQLKSAATAATTAALTLSDSCEPELRVLRALGLHMLEGFAPHFFAQQRLYARKAQAFRALAGVPHHLTPSMSGQQAQDCSDAWFLKQHGPRAPRLDSRALQSTLKSLKHRGETADAWIIECNVALARSTSLPPTPLFRNRLLRLYALAHQVLFATHYFGRQARPSVRQVGVVTRAAGWVVSQRHVDLAGELLWVLQLVDTAGALFQHPFLKLLLSAQQTDGSVVDDSLEASQAVVAHTSFVAALAFARMCESDRDLS
jgi:hypothetical protein